MQNAKVADTPALQGYNMGLFMPGSNAPDWWRYSGANAARIFLNPSNFATMGSNGVASRSAFLSTRTALRANPLSSTYFNWTDLEDRFENSDIGGYRINYVTGTLAGLGIEPLFQITASESTLPISTTNEWRDKWRLWKHYYAMAFHLGRRFDVRRYGMFNEPDHPNASGLTPDNWLVRIQLASDAIRCAVADVNRLYGKNLVPLVYAPTTSGASYDATWEGFAFANRRTDFLGNLNTAVPLFDRYDYHNYDSSPSTFGSRVASNRAAMAAAMPGEPPLPLSITELNVNSGASLESTAETLDSPARYSRLGSILAEVARNGLEEFFVFKFTQTASDTNASGFAKNGTHYADTTLFPYQHGGATQAAEVTRLFAKGFAPGRDIVAHSATFSLQYVELLAARDPASRRGAIFSANDSSSSVSLAVDLSAWSIPDGSPAILEEVGTGSFGAMANDGLCTVTGGRLPTRDQASGTVWLYSIAPSPSGPPLLVPASDDATLRDGAARTANDGAAADLIVRADDTDATKRGAVVLRFPTPAIYPPDLQFAVLELNAAAISANTPARAFVYGLADASWSQSTITWSGASFLRQNVALGNRIRNNVVAAQGVDSFFQGQLSVAGNTLARRQLDVTAFVRSRLAAGSAAFLIAQEYRWDVDLLTGAVGDTQPDGIRIVATEAGTEASPGPRLRILRRLDSDGDGLSDEAEITDFKTDPAKPDTDGDGQSDGAEYIAGTDPLDANSCFRVTRIARNATGFEIEWAAVPGKSYVVERSTSLDPGSWTARGNVTATGASPVWTDGADGAERVFYRVRVP